MTNKQPLTYLDWQVATYCDMMAKTGKPATVAEGKQFYKFLTEQSEGTTLISSLRDERNRRRFDVGFTFTRSPMYAGEGQEELFQIAIQQGSQHPVVHQDPRTVAIQVTEPLLDAFHGAKLQTTQQAWDAFLAHAWYIDFTKCPLPFTFKGQPKLLRAVFSNPITGFCRDLTYAGGECFPPLLVTYDNGTTELPGEDFQFWYRRYPYVPAVDDEVISLDLVENLENLLDLLVTYYLVAPPQGRETLPRLDGKATAKMMPHKQIKQLAERSLFHVVSLTPPTGNFGRDVSGGRAGWTLDKRVKVRGHFRLQPYPSRNTRELIWIKEYQKGPKGAAPTTQPLYRL